MWCPPDILRLSSKIKIGEAVIHLLGGITNSDMLKVVDYLILVSDTADNDVRHILEMSKITDETLDLHLTAMKLMQVQISAIEIS